MRPTRPASRAATLSSSSRSTSGRDADGRSGRRTSPGRGTRPSSAPRRPTYWPATGIEPTPRAIELAGLGWWAAEVHGTLSRLPAPGDRRALAGDERRPGPGRARRLSRSARLRAALAAQTRCRPGRRAAPCRSPRAADSARARGDRCRSVLDAFSARCIQHSWNSGSTRSRSRPVAAHDPIGRVGEQLGERAAPDDRPVDPGQRVARPVPTRDADRRAADEVEQVPQRHPVRDRGLPVDEDRLGRPIDDHVPGRRRRRAGGRAGSVRSAPPIRSTAAASTSRSAGVGSVDRRVAVDHRPELGGDLGRARPTVASAVAIPSVTSRSTTVADERIVGLVAEPRLERVARPRSTRPSGPGPAWCPKKTGSRTRAGPARARGARGRRAPRQARSSRGLNRASRTSLTTSSGAGRARARRGTAGSSSCRTSPGSRSAQR